MALIGAMQAASAKPQTDALPPSKNGANLEEGTPLHAGFFFLGPSPRGLKRRAQYPSHADSVWTYFSAVGPATEVEQGGRVRFAAPDGRTDGRDEKSVM